MSQFLHQFPEVQDNGSPMRAGPGYQYTNEGRPIINGVKMENLRLHQLRNLARAWQVKVNMDAPKNVILPALMAAADSGVFRNQPNLPYYAWMALRTGDEKMPLQHPHFEYPDGLPAPKPVDPDALPSDLKSEKTDDPYHKMYVQWTYDELKAEAKKIDKTFNVYGVSRVSLGRFLYEHGVLPAHKPLKHPEPVLQE